MSLNEDVTDRLYRIAEQRQCSVNDVVADLLACCDAGQFAEVKSVAQTTTAPDGGLRALVDSVNDVMFVLDADQRHTGVYGQWMANFGMSAADFIGKTPAEIMGPEAAAVHIAANERALRGEHVAYEWVFETDHEAFYFQTALSPIIEPDGTVSGIAGLGRDITELKRTQAALRESEERHRLIFELSHTGIVWADSSGHIIQANPAFCKMVGYTHEDLRQMSFRDLTVPEDMAREMPLLQSLNAGERDSYMIEKYLPTRSGEYRLACVSISVSRNLDGSPRNYVGVIEDITERKRTEKARFEYALKQERLKLLSDFVQGVAHEFRTPLSVINTNAYLMELAPSAERRSKNRSVIQEQVSSIAALVDSMILMARLDGEEADGIEEIDPREVLQIVSSELHEALYRKQIQLVPDIKAPLPRVRGMIDHLITAIRKIVENAIRFSPFGGTVVVSVDTDGENLVWSIQDFGPGIHEQALARIFELFYREDQARTERGFGLGLPIAQRIIEQHQGQIEVESYPGQGSVFRVVIPAGHGELHSEPAASQTA